MSETLVLVSNEHGVAITWGGGCLFTAYVTTRRGYYRHGFTRSCMDNPSLWWGLDAGTMAETVAQMWLDEQTAPVDEDEGEWW